MRQKILIIDDNKGDLVLIKELFEKAGLDYQILWTDNGKQGLEIAKNEMPEVVFLDTLMPEMGGFEACEKLRSSCFQKMYIVMMSGTLGMDNEVLAKKYGADSFCIKNPESILSAMLKYLQQMINSNDQAKKINILLVEDNKGDQVLFQEALKETGVNFELYVLERADKIVHFVEKLQPRLIFMDVMMSGVTGGDAVRLLRHNAKTKDIPVAFLTGIFGLTEELKQGQGINVDGQNYPALAKPVRLERLMVVVKDYV